MARVINLGRVRKYLVRDENRAKADINAVKFGRSKAEKLADSRHADAAARHVDGHKIHRDDPQ